MTRSSVNERRLCEIGLPFLDSLMTAGATWDSNPRVPRETLVHRNLDASCRQRPKARICTTRPLVSEKSDTS